MCSSDLVYSLSSLPQSPCFLTGDFSIQLLWLALMDLPQSTRVIRARHYHNLLANPREKLATMSLAGVFTFSPPIPHVFSPVTFQLNCCFVASMEGPSSVIKSITMPSHPDDHLGDLDGEDELSDQKLIMVSLNSYCS